MKEPWEIEGSPWKTKSSFFSWLRGGLRRGIWEKNPIKLEFIESKKIRIPGARPNTTRWGYKCDKCGEEFPANSKKKGRIQLHVDHVKGNVSLKAWDDVFEFVKHLSNPQELRILCLDCHFLKSFMERYQIDKEEDALLEIQTIEICKKKPKEINDWLLERGYNEPLPTNAKQRREVVRDVLEKLLNEK